MIIDGTGNEVCKIKSAHMGMGMVEFVPKSGESYKAVVDNKSFRLPTSESEACVLTVGSVGNDSIIVGIAGSMRQDRFLIAHNGGIVTLARDMSDRELCLERTRLGSGIVQLLLVDCKGKILSSRMIFNHTGYIYSSTLDSLPAGDYAVKSLRGVRTDSTFSIVSNILLQSELKGYIEDPDYYFRSRDTVSDSALDLLMLTQGWERYDLPSALKGEYASPEVPLEIGGEISGQVRSRWKAKPLSDAAVMLISPQLDYASQAITDSEGRFVFNGMDWPENTAFIIQVFGESGSKEHNYSVDQDDIPVVSPVWIKESVVSAQDLIDERLLTSGTVMLEELVVTAPMSAEESRREMLSALGVRSFTAKELEDGHITTYEEVLRKIPGLRVVNGNVISSFARGSAYNTGMQGSNVEFWVDGVQWTPTFQFSGSMARSNVQTPLNAPLQSEHSYREYMGNTLSEFAGLYPFDIVESIEYYRPSVAMVISMGAANAGGALVVTTKDGSKMKEWDADLFMKTLKPIGYQNKPEAYEPHFIYDPTTDDGTFNAAWFPRIKDSSEIPSQEGCFMEIEGMTDGGEPVLIRSVESEVNAK